jgi:hypothetical protein
MTYKWIPIVRIWELKWSIIGHLLNGVSRILVIYVNDLWVLILHYTICFVAYTKEALIKIKRKKRGIREEKKGEKKRDRMPQRASSPGLCKISYC